MKFLLFSLLAGVLAVAGFKAPDDNNLEKEPCNCTEMAEQQMTLFKGSDFEAMLLTEFETATQLAEGRILLANYFKNSKYSSAKLKAEAANASKRIKANKKAIKRMRKKALSSTITQESFIEYKMALFNLYELMAKEDQVMGYKDKGNPGTDEPLEPVIPPGFDLIDCSGNGSGKTKAECESDANDMLYACRSAIEMKSGCGYYEQFGENGQDVANNEMAACRDKAFAFAVICSLGGLGCGDDFGGSLRSFGSGTKDEIMDDALADCAALIRNAGSGNPPQTQTSGGN